MRDGEHPVDGSGGADMVKGQWRRRAVPLAIVAVACVATVAPTATAEAPAPPGPNRDVTVGPLISGTSSYVAGTFAWTDYAYDDRGPSTDGSPGGDAAYPASVTRGNAADLVQLQLSRAPSGALVIRAVLETLLDPSVPLLGVGFDTDGNAATGAPSVPGGGWTVDTPLGLDSLVTISSDGATLRRWNGSAWVEDTTFDATVDPASNSMTAVVPKTALKPGEATWRAIGVLGLAAPRPSWLDGTGPVHDLAFVAGDLRGWQDVQQADVLTGAHPATDAVATVDFAKVKHGVTALASTDERGYYTFLYHSDLALGEGINEDLATVGFEPTIQRDEVYAGPFQPYLVHVPGPVTAPTPAILFLHGREGTHLQGQDLYQPEDAILVSALGRGPTVGYGGTDIFGFVGDLTVYGEQDVLDVLDDVTARFPIDPDRVLASGFSMGAVGAFHIAEFYPDRFTGVLPIGGGDYGIGINRMRPGLLPNLSAMPLRTANGGLDPLASAPGVEEILLTLDTIGTIDYRAYLAFERAHELYRPLVDCLFEQLIAEPRVVDPPRVIYRVNPAFEFDDPGTGLRVQHTRAYWVSDLELRDPAARNPTINGQEVDHSRTATIDVTSLARPERTVSATPVAEVGENYSTGADFCGPNPDVQTNDTWRMKGLDLVDGPSAVSNGMTVTLQHFSSATLDLARMDIDVSSPVTVEVTGDGPAALVLDGPWNEGADVTIERAATGLLAGPPETWTVQVEDGAVRLADDFGGTSDYTLTAG